MTSELVLWFDPRSSSCERALLLLRASGVEPRLRRFLEAPPTPDELRGLLLYLGLPASAVCRKDADEYQSLRLSDRTPEDELLTAIAQHPRILVAPIVVRGDRAVVARPPERALELVHAAA